MHLASRFLAAASALSSTTLARPAPEQSNATYVSLACDGSLKITITLTESGMTVCNDGSYELFHEESHTSKASAFCSTYIPLITSALTATVSFQPATVFAETTTVTPATTYVTVTNSDQVTNTVTEVIYTSVVVSTTETLATFTDIFSATSTLTTTDATSFTTEVSSTSITTTDATSTSVETDLATVTVSAPARKRSAKCGKPDWLSTALTNGPYSLSSACSCLIPVTPVTVTVTEFEPTLIQTSLAVLNTTAAGTQTTAVTETDTEITTTTATAISTTTIDATATTSVAATVIMTEEVTAAATETVTSTITIHETSIEGTTTTATATTTAATAQQSGQCENLSSPYIDPSRNRYEIHCSSFFPITPGGLLGSYNTPAFSDCINKCADDSNCKGVDYDPDFGLCDTFRVYEASSSGFVSALKIN